ncbi:hypothetical protein BD410DRAFT_496450 [Rickenella mellea]|uniref:Uncharacterized protein n=1 Tax=Rickenella mellea TaxID=50990 RepID=A0A4Y7PUE5_9AGAM|nr:hypothetical protein BD410DRAFT_496450 [Rickenella mellea]
MYHPPIPKRYGIKAPSRRRSDYLPQPPTDLDPVKHLPPVPPPKAHALPPAVPPKSVSAALVPLTTDIPSISFHHDPFGHPSSWSTSIPPLDGIGVARDPTDAQASPTDAASASTFITPAVSASTVTVSYAAATNSIFTVAAPANSVLVCTSPTEEPTVSLESAPLVVTPTDPVTAVVASTSLPPDSQKILI